MPALKSCTLTRRRNENKDPGPGGIRGGISGTMFVSLCLLNFIRGNGGFVQHAEARNCQRSARSGTFWLYYTFLIFCL